MPKVPGDMELETLTECQYSFPVQTVSELQTVRSVFPDLRLYVDFYCYPNKEKKRLVYLAGTVPVKFDGHDYNIPVCIWLHETHPVNRPRCYVCPSVSMVINPACPCVDAGGNISLDGLSNWTSGVSNLLLLITEMRRAFQKDTPLYATPPVQAPPTPAGVQVLDRPGQSGSDGSHQHPSTTTTSSSSFSSSSSSSSSLQTRRSSLTSIHLSGLRGSQWEQGKEIRVKKSYTEELLGIDFSAPGPPPSSSSSSSSSSNPFLSTASSAGGAPDSLSRMMGGLRLDSEAGRPQQGSGLGLHQGLSTQKPGTDALDGPDRTWKADSEQHWLTRSVLSGHTNFTNVSTDMGVAARLPPDKAAMFLSLVALEGRSFNPTDALEAVQLNKDLPSALKFLTHNCPICQDQVSFSKIITMTHCSCCLCQSCFKAYFSTAIKEKSIDQLVCPMCSRPEVRGQGGMEESMDYFNLLDTQIRHYLEPQIHELFQRKLRDRALQEMPNFCWCAHCSFGMLHEADRLRMDCPSCRKSTCSQCRSAWSPQHQGVSCQQFRAWQQQNQPDQHNLLRYNSIECPNCQFIFYLSKGGCLHFTCSQCQHQFCGGCRQPFGLGSVCGFSVDCGAKGLHAHHPRDCLYHLRDWGVARLHLLLQHYSVSLSWLGTANGSSADSNLGGVCSVLELRDAGSRREEPCGRPALPEYRGYCQSHYKERLVELINRSRADPAVLFGPVEMMSELRRWLVAVPTRRPQEAEPLYAQRLRTTLTSSVPLRKHGLSPVRLKGDLCPLPPPPPTERQVQQHLLMM
ncbi:E3 ubiquitin-protein ligase RNF31 [Centroberyx gerrardi]